MAENELQLLENVELKIAMCDTDAQFERCIDLFLTPVLLKMASPHEQVRKKVMGILSHINKRTKPNPSIKIPFDKLIQQLTDEKVSIFVKNFTIIYLEMGVERMTSENTIKYLPSLLKGISKRPESQRTVIFHMILPALKKWNMDTGDQKNARQQVFGFEEHPEDAEAVLKFFLDLMLYQPTTGRSQEATAVNFGLSPSAVESVTNKGKANWSAARIAEAKLGILKFVLSYIFTDEERLRILIAGASDPNHEVVSMSEDGIRRWTGSVDLEEAKCIQSLYTMYLGTKGGAEKDRQAQASVPVKIRILQYLSKSITAASMVTQMIQVVFDGIYGEGSTLKLRRSTMAFLQWSARMCDGKKLEPIAPILISGLLKYIDENQHVSGHDAESIKGYAYLSCGLIYRKVPNVALKDAQLLEQFFDNLEQEHPNIRTYVQDALSSMIDIYTDLPEDSTVYSKLQEIILKNVQKSNVHSRYMALKYANSVYPFSSVFARYVCLLGGSSSVKKLEVKEESSRGLHPFQRNTAGVLTTMRDIIPNSALPKFKDLVIYLARHKPDIQYVHESKTPVVQGYPVEVYSDILRFVRMILVLEANPTTLLIDEYIESKVDNSIADDPVVMENFRRYIKDVWSGDRIEEKEAMQIWLHFIENSLDKDLKDPVLLTNAARSLLEIISLGPPSISAAFKDRLDFFKSFTVSEKQDVRDVMSHIFGIIASDSTIPTSQIEAFLEEYCNLLEKPLSSHSGGIDVDRAHGALLSIGYLLSRCIYRQRLINVEVYRRCIQCLSSRLEGAPGATFTLLASAACRAFAEIGRIEPFPLAEKRKLNEMGDNEDMALEGEDHPLMFRRIIEQLAKLAKTAKENKIQEQAILALGNVSIPLSPKNPQMSTITDALFASADTKQVDLYFAGGEAWSLVAFGWESQAMEKHKDVGDLVIPNANSEEKHNEFQAVIEKIARTYVTSDRAWYRKASCIWLLSILKFGKDQELIKKNLEIIHASFSRLIADRDDFTQEVASKGLGLVYEYGNAKIKEDMLYSLVGTFTEGRSIQAQSVTDNTVLFEEGAFGTTPDGNSISTYKELCSLASELNQPDLIYKFMNLANHNAIWTSRRGAAFGFQNLMAMAEKELEPYLPRLVPKLYRYQFDPNPQVNLTMKTIWQSLVRDNQKTIDKYFTEIMEDVLSGLGNRQWRVREASCAALTDLIQGLQLAQIEPYLERFWLMSFRALDDIKESVRRAATQTCRSLTRLTVRYCDPTVVSIADGIKVVGTVMPFLLERGIVSDAEDVRKFSLDALLNICKNGSSLLKGFIPELVDVLLQSLSSMEPQAMNYLTFHAEKYNITQEQLDNARLSGAKNSPMMEGIEHCVKEIDDKIMQELTPRIINIIKKGTGLPTKAGCARFIVTLCMNRRTVFEPYADTFLKALSGAIKSKNTVIRKTYATAIGYVCQLATYDRLCSLVRHLKKLYIENNDEDSRAASAVTTVEITRFATDRMNAIATEIVPLIYVGEHDPEKSISNLWKDAWENLTSGTRSYVSLYADEIITFTEPLLSSSSWSTKQTAALAIADMCKTGGKSIGQHADKLMPVMVSTLSARSWAGKEHVLEAFVQLCISVPSYFDVPGREPSLSEVVKIIIREAKRRNRVYQRHALASLRTFANSFGEKVDMLGPSQCFLTDLCEMDETAVMEEDDNDNLKPLLLIIKANAFKALVAAFRPQAFPEHAQQTRALGETLVQGLVGNVWNVQQAILESLKSFIEQSVPSALNDAVLGRIIEVCGSYCLTDSKYSAIRTSTLDVLDAIISFSTLSPSLKSYLHEMVKTSINKEPIAALKERLQSISRKLN
ncbi:proteasome stabiliser-domain-containing protein [Dichotomocladium elegans]|nr:proteasome stabiliser-domain-containing protein [Dichotomocladium elegans]